MKVFIIIRTEGTQSVFPMKVCRKWQSVRNSITNVIAGFRASGYTMVDNTLPTTDHYPHHSRQGHITVEKAGLQITYTVWYEELDK